MKVAFTSKNGEMIDQHFGQAEKFYIFDVTADSSKLLSEVEILQNGGDEEDRIAARSALLKGCAIVYTMQIGGPAAAKLVALKIHPMKTGGEADIQEIIKKLQEVLSGNPPPWLKKALNQDVTKSFLED